MFLASSIWELTSILVGGRYRVLNEAYIEGHTYLLLFFPHLFCMIFYLQVEALGIHTCNSCNDLCRRRGFVNF
jgi:hypothetical protein